MAIDTVITLARAFGEVPVTRHAAMGPVLVVSKLRTVTLSTQLHCVCVGNGTAVSKMQSCVAVLSIVARSAGQLSVIKNEALMEIIQISGCRRFLIR